MTRIGLYGGTFDPPHCAHLQLADWTRDSLNLDLIYFIPAAVHAFKNQIGITPADLRFKMVKAAIAPYKHFRISRIELDRPGVSYAIDTLKNFIAFENLSAADLYYIIGSDNLQDFKRWKDPDLILDQATLAVIRRAGFNKAAIKAYHHKKIIFLNSPIIDISATEIREKLKTGQDVSEIVPSEVEHIIRKHHLYQPA
jgi:nicotinate-nucleotide adenylyltransferase